MRYMVISKDKTVFMTEWYTNENCWNEDLFCVIDTIGDKVTFDGETWIEAEYDHL
jgi:hypothetical protein